MSRATTSDAGLYIGLAVVLGAVIVVGAPLLMGSPPLRPQGPSVAGKPVDLDAAPDGGSEAHPQQEGVNNAVVSMLMRQENQQVIDLLEPVLQADLKDKTAAINLAIAYNNLSVKQADDPQLSLDSLWRSYSLVPDTPDTTSNIGKMLKKTGVDPFDPKVREANGDKMSKQNCLYGAFTEYSCAISEITKSARDDQSDSNKSLEAISKKLADVKARAVKSSVYDIDGALYVKVGMQN
jgi:hypothetical protein